MQVVILAAGLGTRLKHLSEAVPKPMVRIDAKPIIGHTLQTLFYIKDVDEVILVTGWKHDILEAYVRHAFQHDIAKVRFLHNQEFRKGSLITIKKAAHFIDDTFLITNADHIFPRELLLKIISEHKDVTIGCDDDRQLTNDDMKVHFENNVLVDMGKTLDQYDSGYTGLTVVDKSLIVDYFACADMTLDKHGADAAVETVLLELSRTGVSIHKCDLSNFGWFEIDTPEDHEIAEDGLKTWKSNS